MEYYHNQTNIRELGNDLYEISCCPVHCFMFGIDEHLPVGRVVGVGEPMAHWSTENQLLNLETDFTCKIVEINQPLIDYFRETNDGHLKDLTTNGFSPTDWVYVVQKMDENENTNPYFRPHKSYSYNIKILPCWSKPIDIYTLELGYFNYFLPLEYYIRNIVILNENCKEGEKICSFEYYPIGYQNIKKSERWEYANKYKKIEYLYAPCDLEKVIDYNPIFNPMLHEQPIHNGWILINIKDDYILKVKKERSVE
ncbi:hypothetical protein AD998_06660 [bacterium 336/3]|nr:hypothetical protein AD998_06660 [bacterium 336/3]